jgi:hypothetical protein
MMENFERPTNIVAYGWRSLLYMFLNFWLGIIYFTFITVGFSLAFGLSVIWIGLPLLALMLVLTRRVANFDRMVASKFLGINLAPIPDDLHETNANPLNIIGAHLTSATTWQSAVYLMMKLPLGITSLVIGALAAPFFLLELLMMVFGVNTGIISGQIMRAMAAGLSGAMGGLTPVAEGQFEVRQQKAKRRLEMEVEYFIDDDGEIGTLQRKRGD